MSTVVRGLSCCLACRQPVSVGSGPGCSAVVMMCLGWSAILVGGPDGVRGGGLAQPHSCGHLGDDPEDRFMSGSCSSPRPLFLSDDINQSILAF